MNDEVWKDVVGYEGLYEVSGNGKVMSKKRRGVKERIIKSHWCVKTKQYKSLRISLYKDGVKKTLFVHRIVADAFVSNPYNKPYVNHIDNNPENNDYKNLEWCTRQENVNWCRVSGRLKTAHLRKIGEQVKNSILKESDIPKIFLMSNLGKSSSDIGKVFGTSPSTIKNVLQRRTWKHVSKKIS